MDRVNEVLEMVVMVMVTGFLLTIMGAFVYGAYLEYGYIGALVMTAINVAMVYVSYLGAKNL